MSWLTDFVRPRIRKLVRRAEIPENLWSKCLGCEHMLFHRDLIANLNVCQHCQYHMRLSTKDRLDALFDQKEYTRIPVRSVPQDPLHFKDSKRYIDRLKEARTRTGETDALILAEGTIGGVDCVMAVFDFDFIGGSMGMAVGEALVTGSDMAIEKKCPLIVIPSSGGARMQEGILSLMQMPRSIVATSLLKEANLPYITILTNPTTGGVAASFASLGDITLAEPGAVIGFTGARVIQETLRITLPPDFQSAEFQREHGAVDQVVHRHELKNRLATLLHLLMGPKILTPGSKRSIPTRAE